MNVPTDVGSDNGGSVSGEHEVFLSGAQRSGKEPGTESGISPSRTPREGLYLLFILPWSD